MRFRGFAALRPRPELADEVACVPYDTVDTAEARALAEGHPNTFLRVVRAELELPNGIEPYSDPVYERSAANFARLQAAGVLVRESANSLYVYRQRMGAHEQRGVVGCCHIDDYDSGLIRRHENTRKDKEDDRTRLVKTLRANSGPVFLTYRDEARIDGVVAEIERGAPLYDFVAGDGVRHTVWRAHEQEGSALESIFDGLSCCYVADGHHRAAAAARAGREERAAHGGGSAEADWFLAVMFPASQLRILPYNRCVADLNGVTAEEFLARLGAVCRVERLAAPDLAGACQAGMYLAGRWYRLAWDESGDADPVRRLDVSFLQDRVLQPLLGVADPRTDRRIDFIGGIRGNGELVARVDSGRAAVAFAMMSVSVYQMMDVADADRIMPPKSTWFEPKLRSGLLVHTF